MLGLYGFFAVIIPVVQYFPSLGKININNQLPITWIMQWNVFFPLMGYFLENRARYFWTAKKILLLWVLDVLTLLVSCILTYFRANMTGVYDGTKSEAFHATFVIINAATIFVTCQYLYARYQWGERISKVIKSAGGCTFGIYLMHFYLLNYAPISVYIWSVLKHRFDTLALLCVFAYCGYVFLTSYVLTVALKKIPILRRLVS